MLTLQTSKLDYLCEYWPQIVIVTIIMLVIAFAGYGIYIEIDSWSLVEGTVISKHYNSAWTEVQCSYGNGKATTCIPVYHPESYTVTIHGIDPKGVEKSRTINVDVQTFEQTQEGQTFKIDN